MMQLGPAVGRLVPLHHNDAIGPSCWSTGPITSCNVSPPAYSGRCRVSSGHVLKKLRTRLDSEISGGRETKYCVCVCVCGCVYVHVSRKRWEGWEEEVEEGCVCTRNGSSYALNRKYSLCAQIRSTFILLSVPTQVSNTFISSLWVLPLSFHLLYHNNNIPNGFSFLEGTINDPLPTHTVAGLLRTHHMAM